jgi:hypothetical protein
MIEHLTFPNIGFLKATLSDADMQPIRKEIAEIQEDFENTYKANNFLVGNIKKEFKISKSVDHIASVLPKYVQEFENRNNFFKSQDVLDQNCPIMLKNVWVNFQERYEFNPVHDHNGLLSFVIWTKIPYKIEDEINQGPGKDSRQPLAGHFCFYFTDALGTIRQYSIPADQTMENTILLFPAKLNHSVHPFYSSEEYRISVSGNICYQTGNN